MAAALLDARVEDFRTQPIHTLPKYVLSWELPRSEAKALAKQLLIRNPVKLAQAARGRIPGASLKLSQLALEDSVSNRVLAPTYKSTGKRAAGGGG